jgi:hypothetical protein
LEELVSSPSEVVSVLVMSVGGDVVVDLVVEDEVVVLVLDELLVEVVVVVDVISFSGITISIISEGIPSPTELTAST